MNWIEIILSVVGSASITGNIVQFVTMRETKAKAHYEADNAHIAALQRVIELQSEEIRRLQERVEKLEKQIEQKDE